MNFLINSKGLDVHPEYGKPGGPPNGNPNWYRGDGGQWRLPPVGCSWKREGIHAAFGGVFGAFPMVSILGATWELLAASIAVQFLGVVLFLAYQITEGLRIRDWAYRDIGGFLTGFTLAAMAGGGLAWWAS